MSEEMKRFILALYALGTGHKEVERAFARRHGETYPSDEELQGEFEAAFAALPKEDSVNVAMSYAAACLQIAMERITPIMLKVIDDFVEAANNLANCFSGYISSIDWQALEEFVRSISAINKLRPQRKPDPVSQARLIAARRHLPNTLAVLR